MKGILLIAALTTAARLRGPPQEQVSATQSPESLLGEALEVVNSNVASLASDTAASQSLLTTQIAALAHRSESAARVLVADRLREKQRRLDEIEREVDRLQEELYSTETECGALASCSACTSSANCVWCEGESRCVVGSAQGPLGGACELYRYKECAKAECRDARSCSACIVLGCVWCDNGEICLDQHSEADRCHQSLAVTTVTKCTQMERTHPQDYNKYVPREIPMYPPDAKPSEKYWRIVHLRESAEHLRSDISQLQQSLESLDSAVSTPSISPSDMSDFGDLSSLIGSSATSEFEQIVNSGREAVQMIKNEAREAVHSVN